MSWVSSWWKKGKGYVSKYGKKIIREAGRVYDQIGGNVTSKLGIDYDTLSGEKDKRKQEQEQREMEKQEREYLEALDRHYEQEKLTEERALTEQYFAEDDLTGTSTNLTGSAGLFDNASTSVRGKRRTVLGSYYNDR